MVDMKKESAMGTPVANNGLIKTETAEWNYLGSVHPHSLEFSGKALTIEYMGDRSQTAPERSDLGYWELTVELPQFPSYRDSHAILRVDSQLRQLVLAKRKIRKLQRALRKAAGREKRLIRELSKSPFQKIWNGQLPIGIGEGLDDRGLYFHFADHAQCKCVVENVNV